jgi:DNA-binding NarL/FixJ family response regulator
MSYKKISRILQTRPSQIAILNLIVCEPTLKKADAMLKVFIADDSIVVRDKLKEMFEELGSIEVVGESGDAEQAVVGIGRFAPEVVVIDIRMPGGGGLYVLKHLKARPPGQIAIILTSFPYPQYREACLAAGADYFFDKTQDMPKLTEVLAGLASKKGSPYVE